MVKLEFFAVDHSARHNLAHTSAHPVSISELESIASGEDYDDFLPSLLSQPLDYPADFAGLPPLRKKIAKLYSDNLPFENVLTTASGSLANFIVFYALIGPGDHVIVTSPGYPQLQAVPGSLGAEVSYWKAKAHDKWSFDPKELEGLIKANTKMIVINNPLNPLGTVLSDTELRKIIEIASEHSIIVFSDEIYRPTFYPSAGDEDETPPSIISLGYENTIATCALSKSYSLAGIRIGWLASHSRNIIELCDNARAYCLITTSQLDERVADFALHSKRSAAIIQRNILQAERNKFIVQAFIDKYPNICSWVAPAGAAMGFIKFTREGKLVDDVTLCQVLHEEQGVLLVPGTCFGKEFAGWVRIGLGMPSDRLREGLEVNSMVSQHFKIKMVGESITVGVIGATGKTGQSVVDGLLSSDLDFVVTSFTRKPSVGSAANQKLKDRGVEVSGYDLEGPKETLVAQLRGIEVLISCITWEHLNQQLPWIDAAKTAGVKRFVPSEWVGPAPRGVIDIKDQKLEILGAIQRAGLPYTIIDVGCWFQVFIPKIPSGKSDHAHMKYIDHSIVGDGNQKFAMTDMTDVGKYVAQIIGDDRTLNRRVLAYTEVLSMNDIWGTMAKISGEEPPRNYVSEAELHQIIATSGTRLKESSESATHPSNIMDIAQYNMGQYRLSWCVRGDNTPEYADYLGYLDFWKVFPRFEGGRTLEQFFQDIVNGGSPGYIME
ncbi:Glutamate-pyruvate aminotransferase AlaA [Colletotrichum gloeosporioides]|uniref:Glutamate-pyruvate aminotransferase AlaA n=1 Tax=Colletotrichum gloeosporioides TaxID=474922 RepID=A0A8H4FI61_COLGL|nr:Glutamate-pyruvate aminotransferase AlaA [Colletotrichum gloeosporioides]KAF3803132.1 Glutamate-pyruvate aminotransferase AlaA [Colletotrichum gloeosporioides]